MLLPADPFRERLRERGQVEEEVLRQAPLRRLAVDPGARVDQLLGVELAAAAVALVAAGRLEAAVRAGPLDVAIGQRVAGRRRERALLLLLEDVPALVERPEQVADDTVVVLRRRSREDVVGDPEVAQVLADKAVVAVG